MYSLYFNRIEREQQRSEIKKIKKKRQKKGWAVEVRVLGRSPPLKFTADWLSDPSVWCRQVAAVRYGDAWCAHTYETRAYLDHDASVCVSNESANKRRVFRHRRLRCKQFLCALWSAKLIANLLLNILSAPRERKPTTQRGERNFGSFYRAAAAGSNTNADF